jgi:adenosylhomocysteine nucleosidase
LKIGIIGAMDEEIEVLLPLLQNKAEKKIAGNIFYEGNLFGKDCVIVKSGVGKVYAALTAQILVSNFKVDKIIFTGLAGSINKEIKIGDIVIGEKCVQYDLDASELGFKIGQIPYTDYRFFLGDKKMLNVCMNTKIGDTKIINGTIITGDLFLNHKNQLKYEDIFKELKGDCLEMEGAAVAQVCTVNNVPFCIIRIISDNADDNALNDFEKFKKIVSQKSLKLIEDILNNE